MVAIDRAYEASKKAKKVTIAPASGGGDEHDDDAMAMVLKRHAEARADLAADCSELSRANPGGSAGHNA